MKIKTDGDALKDHILKSNRIYTTKYRPHNRTDNEVDILSRWNFCSELKGRRTWVFHAKCWAVKSGRDRIQLVKQSSQLKLNKTVGNGALPDGANENYLTV